MANLSERCITSKSMLCEAQLWLQNMQEGLQPPRDSSTAPRSFETSQLLSDMSDSDIEGSSLMLDQPREDRSSCVGQQQLADPRSGGQPPELLRPRTSGTQNRCRASQPLPVPLLDAFAFTSKHRLSSVARHTKFTYTSQSSSYGGPFCFTLCARLNVS